MAVAPIAPFVPVEDYLRTAYHPDVEYVDGVLVERANCPSLTPANHSRHALPSIRKRISIQGITGGPDPDRRTRPLPHPRLTAVRATHAQKQDHRRCATRRDRNPVARRQD